MKSVAIPVASRRAVHERDQHHCRVCGIYVEHPELHHLVLRSQARNRHEPENLISLCYRHHRAVHTYPSVLTPALQAVLLIPSMTALSWLRWQGVDIRGLDRGTL